MVGDGARDRGTSGESGSDMVLGWVLVTSYDKLLLFQEY